MGMFDTIIVSQDLPINDAMKRLNIDTRLNLLRGSNPDKGFDEVCEHFQTKDLVCSLLYYKLENNKLYEQKFKESKWIEPDPKTKDELSFGHLERSGEYWEEVPYHGIINFYTGINDVMDRYDVWVEYKATFSHGTLENVELFEFNEESNEERRNKEIKWKMLQDYEQNLWYNKYIFHRKLWRKFQFKVWYKSWNNLGQICFKISRYLP